MSNKKEERLYIRTTKSNKEFLQAVADDETDGNINALFDLLIKDLKKEYGWRD